MEAKEIIRLIKGVLKGERHKDYQQTVEYAALCSQLYTGEGMDSLIDSLERRETKEEREQRLKITQHITMSISQSLADIFFKTPRSNSIKKVLEHRDPKAKEVLDEILNGFWGKESFDEWLDLRIIEMNFLDPNAFEVIEWKPFDPDQEYAQPYPFEVYSKEVYHYGYQQNMLRYLLVKGEYLQDIGNGESKIRDMFTLYLPDRTLIIRDHGDQTPGSGVLLIQNQAFLEELLSQEISKEVAGEILFWQVPDEDKIISIEIPIPHNLGKVPAFRVGYKRNPLNNGRTMLSPLHKIFPLLKKTIKVNSELDISMTKHAFPMRYEYSQRCKADGCQDGRLKSTGEKCPACGGTGWESSSSSMDVIRIGMPRTPEEMFDLDKLLTFKYPPVEGITFQDQYLDRLIMRCHRFLFGSDMFSREEISNTATGKNLDEQRVYDTLYPLAEHLSSVWEFGIPLIAKIVDLEQGLEYQYNFSKDFRLKTKADYISDYKEAKDAGLGNEVLIAIEDSIISLDYSENPLAYLRYKTQQYFDPFRGKTSQETLIAASSPEVSEQSRILWLNMDSILMEIELEDPKFYGYPREKQWGILKGKVEAIQADIQKRKSAAPLQFPEEG